MSGPTRLDCAATIARIPMAETPDITWHAGDLTRHDRFAALGAHGCTMWFTGLSASGKSTIASALEKRLVQMGTAAYRLDGDNIRMGLNRNLGFSAEDRAENIRRIGEVSRLFADAGVIALTSFISPYLKDRQACRALHVAADLPFLEVFIDTPIEVCEQRDPKGLYKKARAGQISGFTGIDDPYEPPQQPELTLRTATLDVEQCVEACLALLRRTGILSK